MEEQFCLRLLGPVEVKRAEEFVHDFESWKAQALLCYLVVLNRSVSRTHLADLFWPDKTERRGRSNLSRVLHNIRTLLPNILESDRQSVTFDSSIEYWVDIEEFDRLVSRGDEDSLARAATLFRDDFMVDIYPVGCADFEVWLAVEREQWRQRTMQVLDSLVTYHTHRGEYDLGLKYVSRALTLERWREEAHRQKMRLLALTGQRSAALAQYDTCCAVLEEELGVGPDAQTTELYDRIRDATLRDTKSASSVTPASDVSSLSQEVSSSSTDVVASVVLPFVGRGDEHTWLVEQWNEVQAAGGMFTLVEGESGLGKTRLVNELLKYVHQSGACVLRGHCYEFGAEIPYQAIVPVLRTALQQEFTLGDVWMAELGTLLPEIRETDPDLPDPPPASGEAARQRLFEAVARLFLAIVNSGRPLGIFLDDLHLADRATLDLLQYLFYRLAGARIWFLGTYRPEDVTPNHPLHLFRRTLRREGRADVLHLQPLTIDNVAEIVQTLPGLSERDQKQVSAYLLDESEGNAFILTQLLQDFVERDILVRDGNRWTLDERRFSARVSDDGGSARIPVGVRELILSRIERLSDSAVRLLELAAIIGQEIGVALLREAASPDIDIADAIEELVGRRILTPTASAMAYEFAHSMIYSVVYDQISFVRRQQLHSQVADALIHLYAGRENQVIERLAMHSLEAGDKRRALRYAQRAAERAEQIYAWAVAIRHYTQVLHLLPVSDLEGRYDVLARREWAYNIIANHRAQEADLRALADLAERLDDDSRRAEVFCRQAKLALRKGQFNEGVAAANLVIELADRNEIKRDIVAESCRLGALCLQNQGNYESARRWGQRALEVYQEEANRQGRTLALNTLGVIARSRGDLQDARQYMEEAVAEWRSLEDIWRLATGLSTLSMLYYRFGEYDKALDAQLEVRELAPQTGDLHLEASSLNSLGLIYHAHNRYADAIDVYTEALEIAQSAGAAKIEATVLLSQAHTLLALGTVEHAEQNYRRSLAIQDEIGSPLLRVETLNGLADCYLARRDPEDALPLLEQAEKLCQTSGHPGYIETLVRKAEAYSMQSDVVATERLAEELVRLLEQPRTGERPPAAVRERITTLLERHGDTTLIQRVADLREDRTAAL